MERTRTNSVRVVFPLLKILSNDQIQDIHFASLEVLECTGVDIFDDEGVELLARAGCPVEGNSRVRIPSDSIEDAVRWAPKRITLTSRDGQRVTFLEGNSGYFGTGSNFPYILDTFTNKRRVFTGEDIVKAALICDFPLSIDFFMSWGRYQTCLSGSRTSTNLRKCY